MEYVNWILGPLKEKVRITVSWSLDLIKPIISLDKNFWTKCQSLNLLWNTRFEAIEGIPDYPNTTSSTQLPKFQPLKQLLNPLKFTGGQSYRCIFKFCSGLRINILFLALPRDDIPSWRHNILWYGTTSSFCITIPYNLSIPHVLITIFVLEFFWYIWECELQHSNGQCKHFALINNSICIRNI